MRKVTFVLSVAFVLFAAVHANAAYLPDDDRSCRHKLDNCRGLDCDYFSPRKTMPPWDPDYCERLPWPGGYDMIIRSELPSHDLAMSQPLRKWIRPELEPDWHPPKTLPEPKAEPKEPSNDGD